MGYPMTMDDLAHEIHATARSKGFYDHEQIVHRDPVLGDVEARIPNPSFDAEKLALIHSEVSEALEAHRDGDMGGVEEELADVVIRVFDFMASKRMSVDHAVRRKMQKNRERERLHGRQW